MITQKTLKKLFKYNPKTGLFITLTTSPHGFSGVVAGCKNKLGYITISIKGRSYKAHRLAWLYMEGYYPEPDIDHIDGNPSNNKFANLRMVSKSCNLQNSKLSKRNITGFKGVHPGWNGYWRARGTANGEKYDLGTYKNVFDAIRARIKWEEACPDWHCDKLHDNKQNFYELTGERL